MSDTHNTQLNTHSHINESNNHEVGQCRISEREEREREKCDNKEPKQGRFGRLKMNKTNNTRKKAAKLI